MQRLEFLGDAVLDYLITRHLYNKHPGMSPGMLTDLRSASVNNDCYAHSAVKVGLHKYILHGSQDLHRHITDTICNFERLTLESTFGWESETSFPKVSIFLMFGYTNGSFFIIVGQIITSIFVATHVALLRLVCPYWLVAYWCVP